MTILPVPVGRPADQRRKKTRAPREIVEQHVLVVCVRAVAGRTEAI
jgi:hypothetical protein